MRARPGQPPGPAWLPDFIPDGVRTPCRDEDPEVFFPVHQDGPGRPVAVLVDAAKQICGRCPVKEPCADWPAATRQRYGYWGGLGPEELDRRRRMRELAS